MLHYGRTLRLNRRMRCRCSGLDRRASRIDLRMRNYLCTSQLLRVHAHHVVHHRLCIAEHVAGNSRRAHRLVLVVNVGDVRDIGDVGNVDVANVGYVDLPQVSIVVVIPRVERLTRSEREPRRDAAGAEGR